MEQDVKKYLELLKTIDFLNTINPKGAKVDSIRFALRAEFRAVFDSMIADLIKYDLVRMQTYDGISSIALTYIYNDQTPQEIKDLITQLKRVRR